MPADHTGEQLRVYESIRAAGIPVPAPWIARMAGVRTARLTAILRRLEMQNLVRQVGHVVVPPELPGYHPTVRSHRLYEAVNYTHRPLGLDAVFQRLPSLWASLLREQMSEQLADDGAARLVIALLARAFESALAGVDANYADCWEFRAYVSLLDVDPSWARKKWYRLLEASNERDAA